MDGQENSIAGQTEDAAAKRVDMLEHVSVSIPDKQTFSRTRTVEAMKRQGLLCLNESTLEDIAELGVSMKGVGVLRYNRGENFVVRQTCLEMLAILRGEMHRLSNLSSENKTRFSRMMAVSQQAAVLAKAITASEDIALEAEKALADGRSPDAEPALVKSFADASPTTIITKETHIHQKT